MKNSTLVFCIPIQIHGNLKLIEKYLGRHVKKWFGRRALKLVLLHKGIKVIN